MSRDIQLAVVAAELACRQARVGPGKVDPERFGIVFGCRFDLLRIRRNLPQLIVSAWLMGDSIFPNGERGPSRRCFRCGC